MLKGYKTIIVNVVIMVVFPLISYVYPEAVLPTYDELNTAVEELDKLVLQATATVTVLINLINIILRAFTTTPVFKKEAKPDAKN